VVVNGARQPDNVNFNSVSADYFRTMGTPLLAGRTFGAQDTRTSEKVAVVTESFARKYFPNQNPVGQVFQIEDAPGQPRPLIHIVGLVKDTKYTDLREPFTPLVFNAAAQNTETFEQLQVVLRSTAPMAALTSEVAAAINGFSPSIVTQFQTMESQVRESLLRERLMATLSGFFGGLAALLATIGLYGVMSYMVARRRNEIGIRIALGADRGHVVRMVMREAAVLLGAGVAVGLVMSVLAARTATTLLFGLQPGDPATLAMAAGGLGLVAMLASYLPAWRASRLEPTEALREE
jgi:putative ABC transport system permease protein